MVRQAIRQGFVEKTITTPDGDVHCWIGGQGPPLLLLHGFGGNGLATWRHQLTFSQSHTVIIPDLLWFGQSIGTNPPGLNAQASAQLALLDTLGMSQAAVVGVSYGGFVAMKMHLSDPNRIHKMIIVDSPGPTMTDEDMTQLLNRFEIESVDELFIPDTPNDVKRLIGLAYHDDVRLPRFVLTELLETTFSNHKDQQRVLISDLLSHRDDFDDQHVSYPDSLVIWGEYDEVFPVEIGHRAADYLEASIVIIPNTSHAPLFESPRLFNQAARDFLNH